MALPAVSIEELSRLIDGQLSPAEEASVQERLSGCDLSRRLLEGMREVHAELAAAFLENPPLENDPLTPDCLNEDALMLLAEGKLPLERLREAEAHAAGCPRCLRALLLEMRSHVSMQTGHWRDLPPEITNHPWFRGVKFRTSGKAASTPLPQEEEGKTVPGPGKISKDAERTPAAASSRGNKPADPTEATGAAAIPTEMIYAGELRHSVADRGQTQRAFTLGEFVLNVLVKGGDGQTVNLELQLFKLRKPWWEAELFVSEQHTERKIFRGLTSRDGRVLVRKIRTGGYEIQAPAANLRATLVVEP